MLKKSILAMSLLLGVSAFAQEAAEQVKPGDGMVAKFEDGVAKQLDDIAAQSGITNYYYATVVTNIGMQPRDPKYILARQAAYDRALANAISQIVQSIQQEMSQSVEHGMLSNANGLKKADLDPKAAALINDAIKKELVAQGVDLKDAAAVKAAMPKVANSETLKKATESVSKLYISGIVTHKTICKGDELGVLVYFSPTMRKFAESLITRQPMTGLPKGVNVSKFLRSLPASEISNTFGTRFYLNENGEPCIVSFYQARVVGNQALASRTAIRFADAYIQDFVGANVAVSEMGQGASSLSTLEDSMGNTTAVADVSQMFKSLAKRVSTKLTYNGIKNVYNRPVRLPSGHRIVIVARMWCPSSQAMATETVNAQQRSQEIRNAASEGRAPMPVRKKSAPKTDSNRFQNRSNDSEGSAGFVL